MEVISSIDFWKFAAPLFGAILAWIANEWRKQYWELYKRKEESYKELLKSVRGYYDGAVDENLKAEFLQQLDLCWLYCPDDVIKKGYEFLHLIQTDVKATDSQRSHALGKFVSAIRKDIYPKKRIILKRKIGLKGKTNLTEEDFKIYRVNQIKN